MHTTHPEAYTPTDLTPTHKKHTMKKKHIRLLAPTVRELIKSLKQFPPDAIIAESETGNYIGMNIEYERHHWADDGDGKPVDYEIAKFSFYSLDDDY